MLVKNEHYKELAIIPELLIQGKYDKAIAVCLASTNKIPECYLTWHLLGLLYLYKINIIDKNDGDYNKQITTSFTESIKIQPRKIPYMDERDLCIEYLELNQKYGKKASRDINNLLSIKYINYKDKILSRIYSSMSRMQYEQKDIIVNIEEANKALFLDDQNPGVYPLLYGLYHEKKKDSIKVIDISTKWLKLKNTNYAQSIMPCMSLSELYAKSSKLKEAAYYALIGLRRIVNYLRKTGCENYYITTEKIVNGKLKRYKITPPGITDYLLDPKINAETAHFWAALSYWKSNDYKRSKKHLKYAIEARYPDDNKSYREKMKLIYNNPVGLLMRIQDVDYYVNKMINSNIQNLNDLYQLSYYLEKTIKNRINKDYYNSLTKYINMSPAYSPLAIVIPKRIYSAVLFAALQKYHCPIWPISDYLAEVIVSIMEVTKQETLYDDLFKSILMKLELDQYFTNYIRKKTDSNILSNEVDRLNVEYKEICELMRLIFIKYGFIQSSKTVDKLEMFVKCLALYKSDKATSMIKDLIESFNEIGSKLSTCTENLTILTSSDNINISNKDGTSENILSWFRETIIDRYVVYTHESSNPQKYDDKYEKDKDKYLIFIDERYSTVRIKRRNRILNFTPKNVFIELLLKNYKVATYSELLKYSKVKKEEEKGREIVSGWIHEINNSAKWKEGEVIINKPNEGYRIDKGVTYCVIYNPKINRVPLK